MQSFVNQQSFSPVPVFAETLKLEGGVESIACHFFIFLLPLRSEREERDSR